MDEVKQLCGSCRESGGHRKFSPRLATVSKNGKTPRAQPSVTQGIQSSGFQTQQLGSKERFGRNLRADYEAVYGGADPPNAALVESGNETTRLSKTDASMYQKNADGPRISMLGVRTSESGCLCHSSSSSTGNRLDARKGGRPIRGLETTQRMLSPGSASGPAGMVTGGVDYLWYTGIKSVTL